jgi:hypothetical protein
MENIITETDGLNTTVLTAQISKYKMRTSKKLAYAVSALDNI